jgi:hypothetical protein
VALWVLFGAYDVVVAVGGRDAPTYTERRGGSRDGVSEILVDAYYCVVAWRLAQRSVGCHVPRQPDAIVSDAA